MTTRVVSMNKRYLRCVTRRCVRRHRSGLM